MSSGITHITTVLAMWAGVILGSLCARRFKSTDLFYFTLAIFVGWLVHVVIYDKMIYIMQYLWKLSWIARTG